MNSDDRRVKLTKRILKEAIIEIMRTKPIHEISIKSICEVADINRSTFYHHYQSPQELYSDIIDDIAGEFNCIFEKGREGKLSQREVVTEMLTYIEEKKDIFLVILSSNGNIGIGERLTGIVEKFIGVNGESVIAVYCSQFISAGVANILWLWLNNEKRLPPDEVGNLIISIITHGVRRSVLFSSEAINQEINSGE